MSQVNNPLPTTSTTTSPSTPEEYYAQWVDQNGIDAEKMRNDGLTAVQRAYDRSTASYGATAEMLRQSGLNNSGLAGLYQNMAETNRRQGNATVYDQYAANVKENKSAFAKYNQGAQSELFTHSMNNPQATLEELEGIAMNMFGMDPITASQMANMAYNSTTDSRNRYGTAELEKLAQSGGVFDPNKFTYMDNAQGVYDSYRSQYSDVYKQNAATKMFGDINTNIVGADILDTDLSTMTEQEKIDMANTYGVTVEELPDVLKIAKTYYDDDQSERYTDAYDYVNKLLANGDLIDASTLAQQTGISIEKAQSIIDKRHDDYLAIVKADIVDKLSGLEGASLSDEDIQGFVDEYGGYGITEEEIRDAASRYEEEEAQKAFSEIYAIALEGGTLDASAIHKLGIYDTLSETEIQDIIDDVMARDDVKRAYEFKAQERAENLATSVGNQIQGGEFKQSNGYLDREAMINDLVDNKGYSREEAELEVKKQVDAETASIFVDKVLNSSAVKWIPYDFRQYVWLNYGNYQEASIEKTKKYLSARFGIPEDEIESFYNSNISPIFAYYAQAIDEGELDENAYGGKFMSDKVDRDWIANNTISKAEKQRQDKTLADNLGSTTNGNGSSVEIAESTTSTMLSGIPTDSPYYSKIKTAADKGDTDSAMSYAYEYAVSTGNKDLQNSVGNQLVAYDLQSMINNGGTIKNDEGDSLNVFGFLDAINKGTYNDGSESAKAAQYSIVLDQMSFNVNGMQETSATPNGISRISGISITASLGEKDYSMHLSLHTNSSKYSDTLSRQYPNAQNGDFGVTVDDEGRHLSVFYQGSWYWIKKSGATSSGDSITDGEWTYLWEALVEKPSKNAISKESMEEIYKNVDTKPILSKKKEGVFDIFYGATTNK